jgi:hypothetical protein
LHFSKLAQCEQIIAEPYPGQLTQDKWRIISMGRECLADEWSNLWMSGSGLDRQSIQMHRLIFKASSRPTV